MRIERVQLELGAEREILRRGERREAGDECREDEARDHG
jgi:hypothetical protein